MLWISFEMRRRYERIFAQRAACNAQRAAATHSLQHATQHATCSARYRMLCSDCSIRYMVSLYFAVTTLTTVGCRALHEHPRQL